MAGPTAAPTPPSTAWWKAAARRASATSSSISARATSSWRRPGSRCSSARSRTPRCSAISTGPCRPRWACCASRARPDPLPHLRNTEGLPMSLVFPPAAPTTIAVAGSQERFPVRRVYCVGRNYAAHAREMGFDPDREPPFFFCKPADSVVPAEPGATLEIPYPAETANYHYEIELVAAIGKAGSNIAVDDALAHVWGYAVGLDMTRRDLQMKMREAGRPWELGKAFDQSAPISPLHRAA